LAGAAKVGGSFGRFEVKLFRQAMWRRPAADQGEKGCCSPGFGLGDADLGRPSEFCFVTVAAST
jgi:hypothetical protein